MSYPVGVTPNFNQYPISYQGVSTPVSPQMWAASPNFAGEDVYVPGQQQEEDDGLGIVGTAVAIGATAAGLFALAKKGKLGGTAEGWANKAWDAVKGGFDKMSSTVKGWFSKSGDDVAKAGDAGVKRRLAYMRELDDLGAAARSGDKAALAKVQETLGCSDDILANKALSVLNDYGLMDDIAITQLVKKQSVEKDLLNRYGSNFLANLG
ncbi:hypothetical protein IJE86_00740 [bacterium]|nr:hypothetical protein [bacterium]